MADSTVDLTDLCHIVKDLFGEVNSQNASLKGMFPRSLQKKLESDPSCAVSLIHILIRDLEQKLKMISKTQSHMEVIPVLHTLHNVIIQAGVMLPTSLYQTVYECLMKLLVLPLPQSALVLRTLRSFKMEMVTPGSLYERRVIAEQNLKSEHFTWQEKVFVLADPAVFLVPLEAVVRRHLAAPSFPRSTSAMERNVVLHVLQRGLGVSCQSSTLAQALEALEDCLVEKYFQKVVQVVEESIKHGAGGQADYLVKIQDIYSDILTASEAEKKAVDERSVRFTPMPFPEINFDLWRYDDDLWNLLADFALHVCPKSSVDEEAKDKRNPAHSEDGDDTSPPVKLKTAFSRRKAYKSMKPNDKLTLITDKMVAFPGSSHVLKGSRRCHTARVVVMGDDRAVARLTRAYLNIRERESKHFILTKKLNLEFYYIPVTAVKPSLSTPDRPWPDECRLSFASLLGTLDPWYDSHINSLPAVISKLARMHSNDTKPTEQNLFLLDSLCYYLRHGTQPVNLPLYSVEMTRSSAVVKDVFVSHLEADIPEFKHLMQQSTKKEMFARRRKTSAAVFGTFISVSYTKISLSKREVVKGDAPMTCGVAITSEPAAGTSGEPHLTVSFNSVNPGSNRNIRTQNISIRTMEGRKLCVCLDKDSRRTYTGVQRIDISPCLDPGCSVRSRFSLRSEREPSLSKYLNEVLSLPINTFTGGTT